MNLGDRIKHYESISTGQLIKRMPVMIRVDGRAFHSLTKGCNKPFDEKIMDSMVNAALKVSRDMQGFKYGYIQSDEATFLLTDYDELDTQGWFDYKLYKLVSMSAAMMSVYFTELYGKQAFFDSRAFNVPKDDVVNAFLWRAKDWKRNSLQMYSRAFFSHKQLIGKNQEDMHNMLHSIGKNWATDLTEREKNGTFIIGDDLAYNIRPEYEDLSKYIVV